MARYPGSGLVLVSPPQGAPVLGSRGPGWRVCGLSGQSLVSQGEWP